MSKHTPHIFVFIQAARWSILGRGLEIFIECMGAWDEMESFGIVHGGTNLRTQFDIVIFRESVQPRSPIG